MMTSSNGHIFRVTGPSYGKFTGHRWIPLTKASDAELWCFLWSVPKQTINHTLEMLVIWEAIALIMMSNNALHWCRQFFCGSLLFGDDNVRFLWHRCNTARKKYTAQITDISTTKRCSLLTILKTLHYKIRNRRSSQSKPKQIKCFLPRCLILRPGFVPAPIDRTRNFFS